MFLDTTPSNHLHEKNSKIHCTELTQDKRMAILSFETDSLFCYFLDYSNTSGSTLTSVYTLKQSRLN